MYCKRCRRQIEDGSRHCPYCGADQRGHAYEEPDYPVRKKKHFPVLWIILILIIAVIAFICVKFVLPWVLNRSGNTEGTMDSQQGQATTLYIMEDGSIVSTTPTPSPTPVPTPTPTPTPTPSPTPVPGTENTDPAGQNTGITEGYPTDAVKNEIAQADIDVRPSEADYVSSPTVRYIATSSGPLNIRRGPDTSYGQLGQIEKGQSVSVYAVVDGWTLIKYNNIWGWCSSDYLSETQPG